MATMPPELSTQASPGRMRVQSAEAMKRRYQAAAMKAPTKPRSTKATKDALVEERWYEKRVKMAQARPSTEMMKGRRM